METLGQKLNAARTARKLTASEAAKGTRIKIQHIQAMEQDDFSSIAAPAYAKGFIRIYADYLGIDSAPLIDEYLDKHAPKDRSPLLPDEDPEASQGGEQPSPRPPFKMPSLPKIPWDKIKLPKLSRPRLKVPGVPPRLLLVYTGGIILFLLILFTVIRCGRAPDEVAPLHPEEPAVVIPSPSGEPIRLERPLPVVDELPEPYLE